METGAQVATVEEDVETPRRNSEESAAIIAGSILVCPVCYCPFPCGVMIVGIGKCFPGISYYAPMLEGFPRIDTLWE